MPARSAGILPFRVPAGRGIEVLLVHPGGPYWSGKDQHAWSVAKGEYPEDELPEHAAEREFAEELGMPAPPGPRVDLGEVRQRSGKLVRVWAVEVDDLPVSDLISNTFEMEWPPRSGKVQSFPEVDRAEWVSLEAARLRLVRGQVEFLDRLVASVEG
jgi:predicted NUDIX family NTP pyrophosphohydrolase